VAVEPGGSIRLELMTPEWRGSVPMAQTGGVHVGVGMGGPGRGVMYPPMDAALLRPMDVATMLRLASKAP
jgi:hypothetical protein